jgi:hypothetical protein
VVVLATRGGHVKDDRHFRVECLTTQRTTQTTQREGDRGGQHVPYTGRKGDRGGAVSYVMDVCMDPQHRTGTQLDDQPFRDRGG